MRYQEFLEGVKCNLKSYLESEQNNSAVTVRKVLKNNGVELDALTIMDMEYKTSPTIYLNSYYKEYDEGRSIEDISQEVYELYKAHNGKMKVNIKEFTEYSLAKKKIAFKVISAKRNKRLLKRIPHIKYADLAIVFYCVLKCDKYENATTLIYNYHMDLWNVTKEELYKDAMENAPVILPAEIKSMGDILREMMQGICDGDGISEDGCYNDQSTNEVTNMIMEELIGGTQEAQMFVLTNKYRINGAAAMFYPNVLKNFANEMDADLIIIPSSIHEVILIPKDENIELREIGYMIRDVNREEVEETDILSDHPYIYHRDTDEITA